MLERARLQDNSTIPYNFIELIEIECIVRVVQSCSGGIMTTNESLKEEQDTPPQDVKATRERSTIVFPYQDLGDAIAVAKGVQAAGGTSCGLDALAAGLGHTSTTSGTFQLRLNTARIFGLLTSSKGMVT